MAEFYGMKDFSLKTVYSISTFDEQFAFKEGDIVVFFRSPILDPSKLIEPKGAITDLVVGSVKTVDKNGSAVSLLVPIGMEMTTFAGDMIKQGPESNDRSLLVEELLIKEDVSLSKTVSSPIFTFLENNNKFLLRTLDVLRKEEVTNA